MVEWNRKCYFIVVVFFVDDGGGVGFYVVMEMWFSGWVFVSR